MPPVKGTGAEPQAPRRSLLAVERGGRPSGGESAPAGQLAGEGEQHRDQQDLGRHHADSLGETGGKHAEMCIRDSTKAELDLVARKCNELGVNVALSEVWAKGGEGGKALAEEVIRLCEQPSHFQFCLLYTSGRLPPDRPPLSAGQQPPACSGVPHPGL